MSADVASVIANLESTKNWGPQRSVVGCEIGKGNFTWVLKLVEALELRCDSSVRFYTLVLNDIEELLAMWAAPHCIKTLIAVMKTRRVRPLPATGRHRQGRAQRLAEKLVAYQSGGELCEALLHYSDQERFRELLACWVQGYAIRSVQLPPAEIIVRFWGQLYETGHPLTWLPLTLLNCERGLRGIVPPDFSGKARTPRLADLIGWPLPEGEQDLEALSISALPIPEHLDAAVHSWAEESNGDIEQRAFRIEPPLPGRFRSRDLMKSLPLDCLSEASSIHSHFRELADVLNDLFSAAVNGGVYGGACGAAYARLFMWRSICAFTGGGVSHSIYEVADCAAQYGWIKFSAESKWFFNEARHDIGIASISSDGCLVHVLAATDMS